jgi:hypothetical protein
MRHPLVGRREGGFGFDGVDRRDPVQRLAGDGGFVVLPLIEEFPSAMRLAGNFGNRSRPRPRCVIQCRKPGIGIGL